MQRWVEGPAVRPVLGDHEIKQGISGANEYLMQMCIGHLTGEAKWLGVNNRKELEEKLGEIMLEYRTTGRAAPSPDCSPIFKELLGHTAGAMPLDALPAAKKNLTDQQIGYIMDEMRGFPDEIGGDFADLSREAKANFHVAICGSGVCGLSVALRCQRAGIPYTIFEKDTSIGGTWHQNTYPGVRCDTPSVTYSFASDPNPNWKYYFAHGAEVKEYIDRMAAQNGITPNVQLETTVQAATFDESAGMWDVTFRSKDGSMGSMRASVYVAAVGQLSNPKIPPIPGQDVFKGQACHTAQYIKGLDFTGKKVAVVGTGATAMGICREIEPVAEHLTIFQSTPQWYVDVPNHKKKISDEEQWCFRNVPFYERWYRFSHLRHIVDFYFDALTAGSETNKSYHESLTEYIKEKVNHDPELMRKMIPSHPPICTRMLVDNHWCTMMLKDNVTLVDGRVERLTKDAVVAKGGKVVALADIVIYATGFQSTKFCLPAMDVIGKGGKSLAEHWGDTPTAYLGITTTDFPNFFMTYGPNTNVSSGGSIIWCAETHGRYIGQCITAMVRDKIKTMEVKVDVYKQYNDKVDADLLKTAWADPGCKSWYKVGATGKVTNNLPDSLEGYWAKTRLVNLDDFDIVSQ